jgi:hypothetical protein
MLASLLTPRLRWCLRSTEILRWESLALPRTPLSQDDGHGWAKTVVRQLIRRQGRGLLLSYFQSVILSGGNGLAREFVPGVERPRVPRRLLLLPRGVPTTHSFGQVPRQNSLRSLYGCQQTRGPSTAQDRPRAGDRSPLDWITTTAPRGHRVDLSFCEEPRLGAKGAVNEDYRL